MPLKCSLFIYIVYILYINILFGTIQTIDFILFELLYNKIIAHPPPNHNRVIGTE